LVLFLCFFFFFSSRRRHTRSKRDWSSDVCSSDLSVAGLDIRHIPYKGVLAVVPDLLGGRVTMMFSPLPVVLPLVREGKLRAIARSEERRVGKECRSRCEPAHEKKKGRKLTVVVRV